MKNNNHVSLTNFIDFVNKTGTQKMTLVKQIKSRIDYDKKFDFYAPFRERVQKMHKLNQPISVLDKLLEELTDDKKKKNYPSLIMGYKKYVGRKKITWFKPPRKNWKVREINISINPELGLEYNGKFYIIKLYLKEDPIRKDQVDQILALMEMQLRSKINEPEVHFAFLNVRKSKLYVFKDKGFDQFKETIEIEAINLYNYWKTI